MLKPFPRKMTIGECYDPAMKIRSKKMAEEYLEGLVKRDMKYFNKTRKEALQMELRNIGYYSGYYNKSTMIRVQKLFSCEHPVFGKI